MHLRLNLLVPSVLLLMTASVLAAQGEPTRSEVPRAGAQLLEATRVFGASGGEIVPVGLPDSIPQRAPVNLVVALERNGQPVSLSLVRTPVRAQGFKLLAPDSEGRLEEGAAEPEATYSGVVVGDPLSSVGASFGREGLTAVVATPTETWRILPLRRIDTQAERALHFVGPMRESLVGVPSCGMGLTGTSTGRGGGGSGHGPVVGGPHTATSPGGADKVRCITQADIAFDCDYEYFLAQGGTVAGTVATVQSYLALNNTMYARDVMIRHRLTALVVRTAPFYNPVDGGDLLNLFRTEWNTNQAGIDRDLAHLMTGKPGSLIQYGGLAWVGVVCNVGLAYGWSMDSAGIVAHETGHNWGAGHCHDTSPCNNMCGACLWVGPNTRDIILAYKEGVSCFWDRSGFEEPVPPYIYPHSATLEKEKMVKQPTPFDVLGKAEDANCDPVSLQSFDATSQLGVPIVLSVGTGPDGRDELLYSPVAPVLGQDSFTFTAGDPTGLTSVGTVSISIPERPLEAYWPLTEGAGETAADATGHGHAGAVRGQPVWSNGPFGGAITFDGVDDHVKVSSVGVHGDQVTLSTWLRRSPGQVDYAGLIHTLDNGEDAGLLMGANGELRYVWAGDAVTSGWNSGIVVPLNQWVLATLVVRDQRAVMYLHDGTNLSKSVHKYSHLPQTFAGLTYLGWNSTDETKRFRGDLADVRIYGRALSETDVVNLALLGGQAEAPEPRDMGQIGGPVLTWTGGVGAISHHVYLGTDFDAVRTADTTSPEYQGSVAVSSFSASNLSSGSTYYWRVDEENWGQVVKGRTWIVKAPRFHHWKLDEMTGTVAVDSGESEDGGYLAGFTLGMPGATPKTGTAVYMDGNKGRMRIGPLNLNDNHATLSAWIKRDGDQSQWAGLIFSRGGNTLAGMSLGLSHELRCQWDGSGAEWNSQLTVPDDQWVFVAMVVEPQQVTLYMGDTAGLLKSTTRPVAQSPEEFDSSTQVGRDSSGSRAFKGTMDDVRFIRGSLSAKQVLSLYQASL